MPGGVFREAKAAIDLAEKLSSLGDQVSSHEIGGLALQTKEAIFRIEKAHAQEVDELKAKHSHAIESLKHKHTEKVKGFDADKINLQKKIDKLKSQLDAYKACPEADFNEHTGTWIDKSTGLHYCPQCWPNPSPMQIRKSLYPPGRGCGKCNHFCEDLSIPMES